MKKVLHNQTGFAKPKEMVAIMGASGSGKTSLLNVLAQRMGIIQNGIFSGSIKVNNEPMTAKDFGKFAAFVQQDDILIETMNAVESFRFAAKLRTSLSNTQIEERVNAIIQRLGLQNCCNTRIGGVMLKGISGGERKRTSIGYELITDPKLILLDEPTSGLDSTTALNIVRILKNEAKRGLTIVSTIH